VMRDISIVDPTCHNCGSECRIMACSEKDDWVAICINQECELGRRGIEQTPPSKPITDVSSFVVTIGEKGSQNG